MTDQDRPRPGIRVVSAGEYWGVLPSSWWGTRDRSMAQALYQPVGKQLPVSPPTRTVAAGFSLFPGRRSAPPTAGDRALQEYRTKKVDAALKRVGVR